MHGAPGRKVDPNYVTLFFPLFAVVITMVERVGTGSINLSANNSLPFRALAEIFQRQVQLLFLHGEVKSKCYDFTKYVMLFLIYIHLQFVLTVNIIFCRIIDKYISFKKSTEIIINYR